MRYKKDDKVVLRSDLEDGEWVVSLEWDSSYGRGSEGGILIRGVDADDRTYRLENGYWIAEDMIDHDATAKLNDERRHKEAVSYRLFSDMQDIRDEMNERPEPGLLSLAIRLHGAKAYRDKLEELHRHIETVERTIEQLNEMDMTIEIED